jgi:type I restriction enzyme R subunit
LPVSSASAVRLNTPRQAAVRTQLPDEDAEIDPVPTTGGGYRHAAELDLL